MSEGWATHERGLGQWPPMSNVDDEILSRSHKCSNQSHNVISHRRQGVMKSSISCKFCTGIEVLNERDEISISDHIWLRYNCDISSVNPFRLFNDVRVRLVDLQQDWHEEAGESLVDGGIEVGAEEDEEQIEEQHEHHGEGELRHNVALDREANDLPGRMTASRRVRLGIGIFSTRILTSEKF